MGTANSYPCDSKRKTHRIGEHNWKMWWSRALTVGRIAAPEGNIAHDDPCHRNEKRDVSAQ
jgi:hypothetical protein